MIKLTLIVLFVMGVVWLTSYLLNRDSEEANAAAIGAGMGCGSIIIQIAILIFVGWIALSIFKWIIV